MPLQTLVCCCVLHACGTPRHTSGGSTQLLGCARIPTSSGAHAEGMQHVPLEAAYRRHCGRLLVFACSKHNETTICRGSRQVSLTAQHSAPKPSTTLLCHVCSLL